MVDFVKGAEKISQSLLERGYPEVVIQRTRRRADVQKRNELLEGKNTEEVPSQLMFAIQNMYLANGIKRVRSHHLSCPVCRIKG